MNQTEHQSGEILISFITSLKICAGYSDFGHRTRLYIENISEGCKKFGISFEILIGEDVDSKNEAYLSDILTNDFLEKHNTKIIQTQQSSYINLFDKNNMLEAPNKNACMYKSKGKFLCITNADILMNDVFFYKIREIKENNFYRFLAYEVEMLDCPLETVKLDYVLKYCEENILKCYNDVLHNPRNIFDISYKSGDIMLMDRVNWLKIKGFPVNGCWAHSDTVVCCVVNNNKINMVGLLEPIRIYSMKHLRTRVIECTKIKNGEDPEWQISRQQFGSLTCN